MRSALVLFIGSAAACSSSSQYACGEHVEDAVYPDGGAYRCVQAEECPRAPNSYVCTTDVHVLNQECVSCTDTKCVRHIPDPCK